MANIAGVTCMRDFVEVIKPQGQCGPVTISVPHNGLRLETLGRRLPRRSGITARGDGATWAIARDVAAMANVAVVRGLLPRICCDYNRDEPEPNQSMQDPAERAFDDWSVSPWWRAYHGQVTASLLAARARGLQPLLIDMHGFSAQRAPREFQNYDIILGTGNRTTVAADEDLFLGEFLANRGYKVFVPRIHPVVCQGDHLNGRYTVRSVFRQLGVSAIQFEIERRFRVNGAGVIGRKLAGDLADFTQALLALTRLSNS